jgi:transcription-repair coupling factor (superfamily II helicase)
MVQDMSPHSEIKWRSRERLTLRAGAASFGRLTPNESSSAAGNWFADILKTPAVQALARRVEAGGALSLPGVAGSAQPFLAALLQSLFPHRPIVIVAENLKTQESFHQDLETWLPLAGRRTNPATTGESSSLNLLFYPAWEVLPQDGRLPHADVISDRLQTLVTLEVPSGTVQGPAPLVVTSVLALVQKTFAPDDLKSRARHLRRGDQLAPLDLIEMLEAQGYEPEAQVSQKGELSLRGGIVDVFPPTSPWPVRLEFFGNELESLRQFDPQTQISRGEIAEITIPPAGEIGILKQSLEPQPAGKADGAPRPPETAAKGKAAATLLDYLPRETIFLLCDPESLAVVAENYAQQVLANDPLHIPWPDFLAELNRRGFTSLGLTDDLIPVLSGDAGPEPAKAPLALFGSLEAFRPLTERAPEPVVAEAQRREFFEQVHRWLRQAYAVHVFCSNDGERQRFEEIWEEQGLAAVPSAALGAAKPRIHVGSLARGFICEAARLVVVTDAEIFGRYKIQRPRRLKSPHALAARSALDIDFTDLAEGDLVVHLQHGIGRYVGLKNLPVATSKGQSAADSQRETECLVIEYAAADPANEPPKLYVPVSEAHLVGKYVGAGKANPPLNTLGGTRWLKAKEQAEEAVRDVAAELLRIQAVRETQPGHACQPDTQWQREFESSFIYEETPDQMKAIVETKADQERPKPMDRLICGDVGFGKTEVAIRAAFKCVMDGRQVAVLVPTTVLAQQHFNNFRERMADYPVRVELLSRFRTKREQKKAVQDLAAGTVDIVIGTHRLVQEDIGFKDLGLVVIDEEQRFGVLHKEKFKRLRTMVDVLTLSATPIPRTLYLALTGARDMSTIQTPPHDRLPVETIATEYDERVIRDAIQRELNRDGQVFFLHNRVMTIETMRAKLQTLVPRARIVVGHGQMGADELEEVMTKFVNGEADVLLSTTIIESGLDIPNANTIIIDRADRFGLSDLYQLRGRVGRFKHQAYAYLLLPRHARLLTDVRKRISAMKQYSMLGSGFKIAMRDLEIRGAGNLLGAEQSGHITAVGFELYCQLLKQSVGALKGEKVRPRVEVRVALDFLELNTETPAPGSANMTISLTDPLGNGRVPAAQGNTASLPSSYVIEPHHRIEIYRKLAQATDKASLDALQKELRDRFGPLPAAVELLLAVGEIKILASEKKVTSIEVEEDKLKLVRAGDFVTLGGKFPRLSKKEPRARLKEIRRLLLAI